MEFNHQYASKGQGNAGVVGAALGGTALLGALSGNGGCNGGGGLLSGIFGGNCHDDCTVNKTELALSQRVAALEAEKYADEVARRESALIYQESRRQDDKSAAIIKDTTDAIIQIGNAVAGQSKEIACLQVTVERNREEAKAYTDTKVEAEAQLRHCEDKSVLAYTKAELATKINAVQRIDPSQICGPSPLAGVAPVAAPIDPYCCN